MKKRIKTKQLGRDRQKRRALFAGLIKSLIEHGEIKTTKAKAVAARSLFEKQLTKAKSGSVAARRLLQADLQSKTLVKKLVDEIAPRYKNIHGGYTKLTVLGNRLGDNARLVKLSLTNLSKKEEPKSSKSKPAVKKKAPDKPAQKKPSSLPEAPTEPIKSPAPAPKTVTRSGSRGDR